MYLGLSTPILYLLDLNHIKSIMNKLIFDNHITSIVHAVDDPCIYFSYVMTYDSRPLNHILANKVKNINMSVSVVETNEHNANTK